MKTWQLVLVALVLPGGLLVAALELWRRWRIEEPDLVPRWKAFIESEPVIQAANVPPVKKIEAVKAGYRVERFHRRMGR